MSVTVNPKPIAPLITNLGSNVLHSDAISGNQWYDQNGIMIGDTNQNYSIMVNGSYYVITSNATCSSQPSNTIQITNSGIADIKINSPIHIYPNPAKNQITVSVGSKLIGTNFTIKDQIGKVVLSGKLNTENSTIEVSSQSGGVYLFSVGGTSTQTFKIVKE